MVSKLEYKTPTFLASGFNFVISFIVSFTGDKSDVPVTFVFYVSLLSTSPASLGLVIAVTNIEMLEVTATTA